jgi:uncharacterized protein YutE (UPF0331/DUF86 family)
MDVIIGKIESIERCISRIYEEYDGDILNLENYTKQDSIVLNIQRSCELCIDIGNYIISKDGLRTPKISRDVFEILKDNRVIDEELSLKLQKMVGFRNIAVHDYQQINIQILDSVINNNIGDFKSFASSVLSYMKK